MLSSYEEALFILTGRGGPGGQCESVTSQSNPPGECQSVITSLSNPPASLPPARKDESRSALKRRRRAIKKRLMVSEQKKEKRLIASGENYEGAADDGYSWRKYGKKPVLNSIYPRSYFKCQAKSCGAKKQEQRSENDPTTVDVTYTGVHTCQPKSKVISSSSQDREYFETQPIDLNAMAEVNFDGEFLDFIGIFS